ncbi:hypothetical protein ACWDE0_21860 [Streptomyces sp. 900105755]
MNDVTTALAAYLIACTAFYLLFAPHVIRVWRATRRPPLADRVAAAQERTGVSARELEDDAFVRALQAELKAYGEQAADYYDKGDPS